MSAAINELYEPSSSPDDIEAWELVKDLAARSTFMDPIASRIASCVRLGKLDRQHLEVAVLSMSGKEGWSSAAIKTNLGHLEPRSSAGEGHTTPHGT